MPELKLPRLYKLRKDNKYQVLDIQIYQALPEFASINSTHGIEDMQMQTDTQRVTEGKNLGKSNETSIWDQAVSEAKSKWELKKNEGYMESKEGRVKLPMLAHKVTEVFPQLFKKLTAPITLYSQPKYDGVRTLWTKTENGIIGTTRKGHRKEHLFPKIAAQLEALMADDEHGTVVDGEIYPIEHGSLTIQSVAGAVNLATHDPDIHDKYCLVIYDGCTPSKPDQGWPWRMHDFAEIEVLETEFIQSSVCEWVEVFTLTEALAWVSKTNKTYAELGYEGTIIRLDGSPYEFNVRSRGLLKYKLTNDDEYEIIDIITPATGRDAGTAIFVCRVGDKRFNAPSVGTRAQRKALYNNASKYIGKMLTVQYQDLTEDGIPRFPKGIVVRDYE